MEKRNFENSFYTELKRNHFLITAEGQAVRCLDSELQLYVSVVFYHQRDKDDRYYNDWYEKHGEGKPKYANVYWAQLRDNKNGVWRWIEESDEYLNLEGDLDKLINRWKEWHKESMKGEAENWKRREDEEKMEENELRNEF